MHAKSQEDLSPKNSAYCVGVSREARTFTVSEMVQVTEELMIRRGEGDNCAAGLRVSHRKSELVVQWLQK